MSTLERDLDYYRRMSTAQHRDECERRVRGRFTPVHPDPDCGGCVTTTDRALFAQLADEIEAHLDRRLSTDLFGEEAVEPEPIPEEADQ